MSSALAHIFMSGGKVTDGARTAVGYSVSPVSMIVGEEGIIIVDTGMDAVPAEKVLADFRTSPSAHEPRTDAPKNTPIFTRRPLPEEIADAVGDCLCQAILESAVSQQGGLTAI